MNLMDIPACVQPDSRFNTGIPLCDQIRGRMKGMMFLDRGVTFSAADMATTATFIAAIKTKTTLPRGQRVYPMWDLLNFEDSTGDPATGSTGNLSTATIVTNEAVPSFQFGYSGGELRHRRMGELVTGSYDVMFVDDAFAYYGTRTANNEFGGYTVYQSYFYAPKFTVGDAVNKYHFRLVLADIIQYRDKAALFVTNNTALGAVGLIDITLAKQSNSSNVYKFTAIADGGSDMEVLNGTALAALTWTLLNLETNVSVVVTSVAKDDTNKSFTVTIDTTAYGAMSSGDRLQLTGPTPVAMAAAGVKPYEMISLLFTKP